MAEEADGEERQRLSAIVFSDIVGYSKMMGEDERATLRLVQEHNALLVPLIQRHRGRVLKFIGDAILSSFASANDAVLCGVDIQRAVAARNKERPEKERFRLRIGIHIGDVTEKDGEVFGDGVNIAARIQPLADPGGVCISQTVYDIVRARREIRMVSLGPRALKNIKESVHIYKVDVGEGEARGGRTGAWALAAGAAAVLLAAGSWRALRRPRAVGFDEPPGAPPFASRIGRQAVPAPAASAPRAKADIGMKAAWQHFNRGQPELALEDLRLELAEHPGSAGAHRLEGFVLDSEGKFADAAVEYAAAAAGFSGRDDAVYASLMRYAALRRAGRDADADLNAFIAKSKRGWPLAAARFYAGEVTERRLLAAAGKVKPPRRALRLPYYIGMRFLLDYEKARRGDRRAGQLLAKAKAYFEKSAAPAAKGVLEFRLANLELAALRRAGR